MNYFAIKDNNITFSQSQNSYPLSSIVKTEVFIVPSKKSPRETILNATANFLSSSISNGNELVDVCIKITIENGDPEYIILSKMPVVRNNLDYHKLVRDARTLESKLKKAIRK